MLGQQNDARMNIALALTAAQNGATIANHCEVLELVKNDQGHIKGAKVRDNLTGDEWEIKAKVKKGKCKTFQEWEHLQKKILLGRHQCYRSFYRQSA